MGRHMGNVLQFTEMPPIIQSDSIIQCNHMKGNAESEKDLGVIIDNSLSSVAQFHLQIEICG